LYGLNPQVHVVPLSLEIVSEVVAAGLAAVLLVLALLP
jgi:hypothetical protein